MENLAFEVGGERTVTIFVVLQGNVPVHIQ